MVIVPLYFDAKRPLAVGIASCGTGLGTTIAPICARKLLNMFSWRTFLRLQAAFIATGILFGAMYRPMIPSNASSTADHVTNKVQDSKSTSCLTSLKKMFDLSLFRSPVFCILMAMIFTDSLGTIIPMYYLNDMALERGLDKDSAALLLVILGAATILTTIGFGKMLVEWPRLHPLVLLAVGQAAGGAATVPAALCYSSFSALSAYAACLGIVFGGLFCSVRQT